MKKNTVSRKQRERLQHKQEILNTSLELFSENGFHNVSMQQIAEKSEFAVGTLYNFFESKEILFQELINSYSDKIINDFTEILKGPGNEKERLVAFIRQQPEFQKKYGNIIKLYVSEVGVIGSKLAKIKEKNKIHEVMNKKISEVIEKGIKKGLFRPIDAEITAKTLSSIMETTMLDTTNCCSEDNVKEQMKKIEKLFIDNLLLNKG